MAEIWPSPCSNTVAKVVSIRRPQSLSGTITNARFCPWASALRAMAAASSVCDNNRLFILVLCPGAVCSGLSDSSLENWLSSSSGTPRSSPGRWSRPHRSSRGRPARTPPHLPGLRYKVRQNRPASACHPTRVRQRRVRSPGFATRGSSAHYRLGPSLLQGAPTCQ